MTSDDFASLTPDIQHPILGLEAYGLLLTEQNERAYSEFAELTNSEYATASDWIGRAESAARLGDLDDYAADVIVIIRRWPDVFAGLPPQNVSRIVSRVRQSHPGSPAYRSLLEAIATDAANTPHSANRSREWRELALEQLDAGDLEQAKLAAGHIVRVWTLISMRADRRFDTLTTSAPELFDIERDEAVAQLESASEMSEDRDSNVSQTINLAGLYARLGRTDLARATLDRVANNASDFGDAEAIAIELRAALADGDTGQVQRSLKRLRKLEDAAPDIFLVALTQAGQLDEAAQKLIRRLHDPDQRMSLLVDLQGYRMLPQGAAERKLATLQVLLERQDVREAVNEVGRIESFDVFQY